MARPLRGSAALLVTAALSVPLTACGPTEGPGGQVLPSAVPSSAPPSPTATATAPAPTSTPPTGTPSPLTGLPVPSALAARPAVAVPLALTASRAPVGVDSADVVFEELAEQGLVRLLALYQTRDAERVGPVGPTRPVDPKLLNVIKPLVVYAGGRSGFVSQLDRSLRGVSSVTHPSTFSTDSSASAPYNRYVSTAACRPYAGGLAAPPPAFDFGADSAARAAASPGSSAATAVTVSAPGHPPQSWRYDPAGKVWRGQLGPLRTTVTTLVVLTVPYKEILSKGQLLLSADVFGGGAATTFVGARALRGRWFKPGSRGVLNVVDGTSAPVRVAPGRTWVVLVPSGAKVSVT